MGLIVAQALLPVLAALYPRRSYFGCGRKW